MRTLKTIREDLRAIRGYYSMKKIIDEAEQTVGVSEVVKTVDEYNAAMREAPPWLYAIYYSLYVRNQTQNALARELYYSTNNIYCMNNKLLQYLQTKF